LIPFSSGCTSPAVLYSARSLSLMLFSCYGRCGWILP